MQAACSLHTRVNAGLSGVDAQHAACNAGQSAVDDGLSGVDARMHPSASSQSI